VKLGILSVAVNVAAALLLMAPLSHGGLALASSLGAYANLLFLGIIARRRFGALGVRSIAASLGRTMAASLALAAWCALLLLLWPAAATRWVEAGWLAGAIVGGTVAFWLASSALAASERDALAAILPWRRTR
jgi:putative peptidoglycan lipid II flippase